MFSDRSEHFRPDTALRDGQPETAPVPRDAASEAAFPSLVEQVIVELMSAASDKPSIVRVAARLSTHVRTLQRRLEPGGRPFREILDQCRRRLALESLGDSTIAVGEIAARLGYSDPAHFTRAVRRWTGCSPSEVRSDLICSGQQDGGSAGR